MNVILFICAAVVLVRCVCIAAHTSRKEWQGHPLQFVGISIGYPLIGGGLLGIALQWHHAAEFAAVGMAIIVLADRRNPYRRGALR